MKTKLLTLMLGLLTTTMSAQQFGAVNAQLSTAGPDGDAALDANDPAVAYSTTQNKYLAVWDTDDTDTGIDCVGGEHEIVGIFYKADGTPSGPKFRISTMEGIGATGYNAENVAISYNETSDSFLVAFMGKTATEKYNEVYGVIVKADGSSALPAVPFRISDMGPDDEATTFSHGYCSIACNEDDDEFLVVWRGIDDVANGYQLFGQRISTAGAELGSDFTITSHTEDIADRIDVAWNSNSQEYMVVYASPLYSGGVAAQDETHGQRVSELGATVGAPFRISNHLVTNPNMDAKLPRIACNPTADNYLVIYLADDLAVEKAKEVYGQLINSDGTEIGSDFKISTVGVDNNDIGLDAGICDVIWHQGKSAYSVFWAADHNAANDFEIYYQNVSATGNLIGATAEVTKTTPSSSVAVAKDPRVAGDGNGKVMFVYEASGNGIYSHTGLLYGEWEIYGNFWDIEETMSTNNAILNTNFNVYPNPNNGQFSVSYKGDSALEKLSVFDITGRMVQSIDLQNANSETINVNLEGVSQGMYVLQIYTKNASVTKKIVIR